MELRTHFLGPQHLQQNALLASKMVLVSVCKHILDDLGVLYDRNMQLGGLYALAASCLRLSADQQQQQLINRILEQSRPAPIRATFQLQNRATKGGNGQLTVAPHRRLALQEPLVKGAGNLANFLLRKHLEIKA